MALALCGRSFARASGLVPAARRIRTKPGALFARRLLASRAGNRATAAILCRRGRAARWLGSRLQKTPWRTSPAAGADQVAVQVCDVADASPDVDNGRRHRATAVPAQSVDSISFGGDVSAALLEAVGGRKVEGSDDYENRQSHHGEQLVHLSEVPDSVQWDAQVILRRHKQRSVQLLLQFIVPALAPVDPVQCMLDISGISAFGMPMDEASGLSTIVPTP